MKEGQSPITCYITCRQSNLLDDTCPQLNRQSSVDADWWTSRSMRQRFSAFTYARQVPNNHQPPHIDRTVLALYDRLLDRICLGPCCFVPRWIPFLWLPSLGGRGHGLSPNRWHFLFRRPSIKVPTPPRRMVNSHHLRSWASPTMTTLRLQWKQCRMLMETLLLHTSILRYPWPRLHLRHLRRSHPRPPSLRIILILSTLYNPQRFRLPLSLAQVLFSAPWRLVYHPLCVILIRKAGLPAMRNLRTWSLQMWSFLVCESEYFEIPTAKVLSTNGGLKKMFHPLVPQAEKLEESAFISN